MISERDTVEDIDHPQASENGRDDGEEASDCENYEEIVTEFVVPSEELENLEAVEEDHEVTEGDREPVEKGPQHGERGNEAFEERIDTAESAVEAEGSTRKRCHPCVHCTEVFMHRFTKKSKNTAKSRINISGPAFCDTSSRSTELSQHQAAKRTTLQPQITTSVQCVRKPSGSALT